MKQHHRLLLLALICSPLLTHASWLEPKIMNTGVFIGVGNSYHSVNVDQNVTAVAQGDVFTSGILVGYGTAGGAATPFHPIQTTFAPDVQAGIFTHFENPYWLGGVKFTYRYLGMTVANQPINSLPFTPFLSESLDLFEGKAQIDSVQTSISNEYGLYFFVAHSFLRTHAYFGAGPVLFNTNTHVYNAIGYAEVNHNDVGVTGRSNHDSRSRTLLGGGVQLGFTYAINPTWMVDLAYSFAMSGKYQSTFSTPYTSIVGEFSNAGVVSGDISQRVTSQGITLTINKLFAI